MENLDLDIYEEYKRWLSCTAGENAIHRELSAISDDREKIADAFHTELEFGTSGMRGIMGAGPNRMNSYVIRRVTMGLADYIVSMAEKPSVVFAYDTRHNSEEFAMTAARIMSGRGIRTFVFSEVSPVSLLSYAVEKLGCYAGVMITASHNPKIYNGYKVYNRFGYQILNDEVNEILSHIKKHDYFDADCSSEDNIVMLDNNLENRFIEEIVSKGSDPCSKSIEYSSDNQNRAHIIYTPFNGTGFRFVKSVFDNMDIADYSIVDIQKDPDPDFSTCQYPNPEFIESYSEGLSLLKEKKADALLATDPDCDRVGVCILRDGSPVLLTGNQLGILILDYLCRKYRPSPGRIVIKSVVTTPFIDMICRKYGLSVINTLTGFKYIGRYITELRQENREGDYFFALEESNGYLAFPFICDKDGVSSAMITTQMISDLKKEGKSLYDRLDELYDEFGYFSEDTENYYMDGENGSKAIRNIMTYMRDNVKEYLGTYKITSRKDYSQEIGLMKSNLLEYTFDNGTHMLIRPSGTEPKLKVYLFEKDRNSEVLQYTEDIIKKIQKKEL